MPGYIFSVQITEPSNDTSTLESSQYSVYCSSRLPQPSPIQKSINGMVTHYTRQHWIESFLIKVDSWDLDRSDRKCLICKVPFFSVPSNGDSDPENRQRELSQFKICDGEGNSPMAHDEGFVDQEPNDKEALHRQTSIVSMLGEINLSDGSEEPVRLSCSHIFGKACITSWLETSLTCPACRSRPKLTYIFEFDSWARMRSLGLWRADRAEMLQRIWDHCIPISTHSSITSGRALEFIRRETDPDEIPSPLIRGICEMMAEDAMVLINGRLERHVEGWAAHPEIRRFSISRHPSDAEIEHMISVMRRELKECAEEIDRLE